jgi:two-component system, OmpR family, phosphate regulon sensor histidine kinase PhoR
MTRKRKLFGNIYKAFIVVLLPFVIFVTIYATVSTNSFYFKQTGDQLWKFAKAIRSEVEDKVFGTKAGAAELAQSIAGQYGLPSDIRITIIRKDGKVLGDSEQDPQVMENHATRPEVKEALAGATGESIRYSVTLRDRLLYVAIPLHAHDELAGVLRVAVSVASIEHALALLWVRIAIGTAIALGLAALVSLWISKLISGPLEKLTKGTDAFRDGRLDYRLEGSRIHEVDSLSSAMNGMASDLAKRIETITMQRTLESAILSTMVEGIVAFDGEKRIITINNPARRILGLDAEELAGKKFDEVVFASTYLEFFGRALSTQNKIEDVLVAYNSGEEFYEVHGIPLRDAESARFGTLVVIHDISKLKHLEKVRKDFAVNVSHELRTPLTAIKGFIETLISMDANKSGDSFRFLGIILKETDRLAAIVTDLMSLARIERGEETHEIEFVFGSIREVCESAIAECERQARDRRISLTLGCEPNVKARINPRLLEQAIVNLVDNAVKYSPEGKAVSVSASEDPECVRISVTDSGSGIPEEHLDRIFERFYRVDQGRSRQLGGTGLGLSIVKHIALVHDGAVTVTSKVGTGSTFTITLKKTDQSSISE